MKTFNEEKEKELFQYICDRILEEFSEHKVITDYYQQLKKQPHGKFIPQWEPEENEITRHIANYCRKIIRKFEDDVRGYKNDGIRLSDSLFAQEPQKIKEIVHTAALGKIIKFCNFKDVQEAMKYIMEVKSILSSRP